MDALKQFWAERAPRERAILGFGASVVLIAVLYLMLIEPAWTGIGRLERSLPQQRSLAAELDALLGEVRGLKSQPQVATVSPSEVRGAIETSLTRAGMKAARIVPLSDGDIQLTFANVPYGTWAAWLAGIERELGARTTSVVITGKDATPGNVDAELALRLARK
ncbi:MAG TPA: type II secretion system protein M [Burkholderiaceae bacterium]|jgi:general secretion pathway protein M|nr:type II secretion system protein M [Burkholderiaceae bacterium]